LIVDGKIIDSKIDAKKGIYAKNVGSEGSNPCRLTVGFDRKYEREMADCKTELDECNRQIEAAHEIHPQLTAKVTAIGEKIEELTREQEKFALQKRQFEEQLRGEGPNAIDPDDEDQRAMLEEMIAEFVGKNEAHDAKITTLKAGHDKARSQLEAIDQQLKTLDEQIEALKEKMALLTEAHKVDPGIAEIKIHGTITHKTEIIAPHKEMTLQKDMQSVRIAESKVEPESSRYHIKISNLR
jgi:chromosome segregation ATPase